MIVFELTMPNCGSWNNKWSQENERHIITKPNRTINPDILIEIIDKDFYYRWDDGWTACISVIEVDSKQAAKLRNKSRGFCGYDWMVDSIIKYGTIKARG